MTPQMKATLDDENEKICLTENRRTWSVFCAGERGLLLLDKMPSLRDG